MSSAKEQHLAPSSEMKGREAKRYSQQKKQTVSPETRQQAMQIARGTQKPGQTKEQTRLIAQGIQKGIEQYKKQQKAKARELDKKIKKVKAQTNSSTTHQETESQKVIHYRQHWLPWTLLVASWVGMAGYVFLDLV